MEVIPMALLVKMDGDIEDNMKKVLSKQYDYMNDDDRPVYFCDLSSYFKFKPTTTVSDNCRLLTHLMKGQVYNMEAMDEDIVKRAQETKRRVRVFFYWPDFKITKLVYLHESGFISVYALSSPLNTHEYLMTRGEYDEYIEMENNIGDDDDDNNEVEEEEYNIKVPDFYLPSIPFCPCDGDNDELESFVPALKALATLIGCFLDADETKHCLPVGSSLYSFCVPDMTRRTEEMVTGLWMLAIARSTASTAIYTNAMVRMVTFWCKHDATLFERLKQGNPYYSECRTVELLTLKIKRTIEKIVAKYAMTRHNSLLLSRFTFYIDWALDDN